MRQLQFNVLVLVIKTLFMQNGRCQSPEKGVRSMSQVVGSASSETTRNVDATIGNHRLTWESAQRCGHLPRQACKAQFLVRLDGVHRFVNVGTSILALRSKRLQSLEGKFQCLRLFGEAESNDLLVEAIAIKGR